MRELSVALERTEQMWYATTASEFRKALVA
jgi:hypothetical protein